MVDKKKKKRKINLDELNIEAIISNSNKVAVELGLVDRDSIPKEKPKRIFNIKSTFISE
jgi:hypothetical protein